MKKGIPRWALTAMVVSGALRRPDGGGPGRFVVTDWDVSTVPLWCRLLRGARPRRDRHAPGSLPHRDCRDDLQRLGVDHRDVIAQAVRRIELAAVRGQREAPGPPADAHDVDRFELLRIDHGDGIAVAVRYVDPAALGGDDDADGLGAEGEVDRGDDFVVLDVDDGDGAADFRGDPGASAVRGKSGGSRSWIDEEA